MSTTTIPIDAATAPAPLAADTTSHRWSPLTRIGFRFAFLYLGIYCIFNGNATVFEAIPHFGDSLQDITSRVFLLPAQYLAQHLFHVPPPGNALHPTGSGDTAINYIACLVMLVLSALAASIWTALDRRRPHYQTLSAWLRFLIRLTLGFGMVTYGLFKVFPMQMPVPSIASLSEPLGMHSPMALLWSFLGTNQVYESICGGAELLAGLLLLFRRTALFGALFTAFVVTNVLLYNLCFDVPVKLYAGHLLLLALFVILPDSVALFRFFWSHQPAAPSGIWVPPSSRRWFRSATIAIELAFAALSIGGVLFGVIPEWRHRSAAAAEPCPLRGAWRIDSATLTTPQLASLPHPILSKDHRPFVELDISSSTQSAFRDDQGTLSSFPLRTDLVAHTLQFTRPDKSRITFTATTLDASHLTLKPTGSEAATASTLTLTLVSPSNGYPLLHRGFHWISELPYQR